MAPPFVRTQTKNRQVCAQTCRYKGLNVGPPAVSAGERLKEGQRRPARRVERRVLRFAVRESGVEVVVGGDRPLDHVPGTVPVLVSEQELHAALVSGIACGEPAARVERVERLTRRVGVARRVGQPRPAAVRMLRASNRSTRFAKGIARGARPLQAEKLESPIFARLSGRSG